MGKKKGKKKNKAGGGGSSAGAGSKASAAMTSDTPKIVNEEVVAVAQEALGNPYMKRKYEGKPKAVAKNAPATAIKTKTHGTRSKIVTESVIVSPEKEKSVEEIDK